MRGVMGVEKETQPLPPPGSHPVVTVSDDIPTLVIPDWNDPQSEAVTEWIESVSTSLYGSLTSDQNPYPKVNDEDKEYSVILVRLRYRPEEGEIRAVRCLRCTL